VFISAKLGYLVKMSEENKKEDMKGHKVHHKDSGDFVIRFKKDDMWKYSTFLLAAILIVGAFVFLTGDAAPTPTANIANNNPTNPPGQVQQVTADADDDAFLGDADAPVVIIEFSDYQCPFCARFWSQTLPALKSEYIDTGKVKFVYRDFPLTSIHPMAMSAAEATECVRDQGGDDAFFEMHDAIFENQPALSDSLLRKLASDLGYDINDCLDSGEFRSEVQNDLSDGQAAGGRGTPYFVINGIPLSGAQPFSAFKQVIDAELA